MIASTNINSESYGNCYKFTNRINIDMPYHVKDYNSMPELPEVESVLRALRDSTPPLPGRMIRSASIFSKVVVTGDYSDVFNDVVAGITFSTISRHGKYLIFRLSKPCGCSRDMFMIVHLRMTGRLFLVPQEQAVVKHTRMTLTLDDGLALRFDDPRKFGRVWLVDDPAKVISGLGPDALTVNQEIFRSKISVYNRQIKPLLLDQSFIAGIGNIYADESLYRAGIHPLTSSSSLSELQIERLHSAICEVLSEAVDANGANIDGVFSEGDFVVSVYGRKDKPCPKCGSPIVKIRVGQRGTHFCPVCQPFT